jgi:hypothetical protein
MRDMDGQKRHALVVSEDFVRRNRWAALLRDEGFDTATCPGPFVTSECPRLDGDVCPMREWAHVAVVDVPDGAETELYGGVPERVCTTLPDDQRTLMVYRSELPPQWREGRHAVQFPIDDDRLVASVHSAAHVLLGTPRPTAEATPSS